MQSFYRVMCNVRIALLNAVGAKYVGKPQNIHRIIVSIVDELDNHGDFMSNMNNLYREELEDLGFQQFDYNGEIMMWPVWLLPFIPDGAILWTRDWGQVIKGIDPIGTYAENYLDVGLPTPAYKNEISLT